MSGPEVVAEGLDGRKIRPVDEPIFAARYRLRIAPGAIDIVRVLQPVTVAVRFYPTHDRATRGMLAEVGELAASQSRRRS